jgi:nucleotide-binding universal stress UspA family protein
MPRIKSLLCPVDLSPASLRAFDYSLKIAQNYRATLHLLHAIAPVITTAYDVYVDTSKLLASMKKQAEPEIRRLRKIAVDGGINAQAEVRTGEIETEITDAIKRHRIDMIVMGKHSRRTIERWFVGSVTDHLLRRVSIPMLIISEGNAKRAAPPDIKRLLVTTDFSEGTHDAIAYALSLAKEAQASVTLLHIVPIPVGVALPFEEMLGQGQSELQQLVPEEARNRVMTKIESGVPYQEILNFAKTNKPDLIVMNIHGKGVFDRLLLGSNAERVIRGASCPVLMIPPKKGQARRRSELPRKL